MEQRKQSFRKFTCRSVDPDQTLDVFYQQLMQLHSARQHQMLNRGLWREQHPCRSACARPRRRAPPKEEPAVVNTHLRVMIILPEKVGSMVGIYNHKTFNQVEIKPEMIGHCLGMF